MAEQSKCANFGIISLDIEAVHVILDIADVVLQRYNLLQIICMFSSVKMCPSNGVNSGQR